MLGAIDAHCASRSYSHLQRHSELHTRAYSYVSVNTHICRLRRTKSLNICEWADKSIQLVSPLSLQSVLQSGLIRWYYQYQNRLRSSLFSLSWHKRNAYFWLDIVRCCWHLHRILEVLKTLIRVGFIVVFLCAQTCQMLIGGAASSGCIHFGEKKECDLLLFHSRWSELAVGKIQKLPPYSNKSEVERSTVCIVVF